MNTLNLKKKLVCIFCCVSLVSCMEAYRVDHLTCEYRTDPLAVEVEKPSLSWIVSSEERGTQQVAYQILVADDKNLLDQNEGNVWNSGKVDSDQSVNVAYAGPSLVPGKNYFWKVKVWSNNEKEETPWSDIAMWRQAQINPTMNWISYKDTTDTKDHATSIWYRKKFDLKQSPEKDVFAEISTPGYYELYINGKKVGKDILAPSISGKDKRTFYVTYNIKDYLKRGENVIAVWVGRGYSGYGITPLAFHSEIPQTNQPLVITTDRSWKAESSSYATLNQWRWGKFGGECFDARMDKADWNLISFDDSAWKSVQEVSCPSPTLVAQPCELNRQSPMTKSVSITKLDNDCYEIDFGRAMTANSKFVFPKLNKGDSIVMYFADWRYNSHQPENTPAGKIRRHGRFEKRCTLGKQEYAYEHYNQKSIYVSAGTGKDIYQSKFNPLAFRYAVVEGLKEAPLEAWAGPVETDLQTTGSFECSNALLNRMHQVNDWTMRCLNEGAVYVDCPQRERMGYGDGQVSVESSIMNYYMPSFYRKFVKDWALRQDSATGYLPHVAPIGKGGGGPGWGGLVAAITWRNYLYYNDKSLLEEIYPVMKKYISYLDTWFKEGVYRSEPGKWNCIGDWLAPGRGMDGNRPGPELAEVFNNPYIIYLWQIQHKAALALNKTEDAAYYAEKIKATRPVMHETFYDSEKGYYQCNEQPYLLMPLMTGIVPDSLKNSIWDQLEDNINQRSSFQTGMFGTYFLINYLLDQGRNDLIYKMVVHENYPGWGYMLSRGATTWWEQWNGFYSHMHSVFTSLDSWFYQGIAGIQMMEQYPGLKKFRISPAYNLPLEYAKASIRTMYGDITSFWNKESAKKMVLQVSVPVNTEAEVHFPTGDKTGIKENGVILENVVGVSSTTLVHNQVCCNLLPGDYVFEITMGN